MIQLFLIWISFGAIIGHKLIVLAGPAPQELKGISKGYLFVITISMMILLPAMVIIGLFYSLLGIKKG